MMSKQDYIVIADAIVYGISVYLYKNKKIEDIELVSTIVTSISRALYSRNTSFNEEIFNDHILKRVRCLSLQD